MLIRIRERNWKEALSKNKQKKYKSCVDNILEFIKCWENLDGYKVYNKFPR